MLSNDDGVLAPGLEVLYTELQKTGKVMVVAPDRNRSGASNSLTLDNPIRMRVMDNGFYAVDGTPTDCVHLAITGLVNTEPDMVISGINAGGNLGDDVIYSGTVAAAMEGRFLGLPSIAVSLVGDELKHYQSAAKAVAKLLANQDFLKLNTDSIFNVNVPDLPWDKIKGFKIARLGSRHKSEPVVKGSDPRGRPIYWVGPAGKEQDATADTDFFAVNEGFVSITPLHVDLTCYKTFADLQGFRF